MIEAKRLPDLPSWVPAGLLLVSGLLGSQVAQAACSFSKTDFAYSGNAEDQARCLLSPVFRWARIDRPYADPHPFFGIVGQSIDISAASFAAYLVSIDRIPLILGGQLDVPISRANNNSRLAPPATYFVIHDTSTPNYKDERIPADIDQETWPFNELDRYGPRAHVYINRIGQTDTKVSFATAHRATKFEMRELGLLGKGLFLHVELVQPRRSAKGSSSGNDAIHPDPAFSPSQLDALAVVYLTASVRAGRYLVPAFHAVVDDAMEGGHDDPQGFPTHQWLDLVMQHIDRFNDLRLTPE